MPASAAAAHHPRLMRAAELGTADGAAARAQARRARD